MAELASLAAFAALAACVALLCAKHAGLAGFIFSSGIPVVDAIELVIGRDANALIAHEMPMGSTGDVHIFAPPSVGEGCVRHASPPCAGVAV